MHESQIGLNVKTESVTSISKVVIIFFFTIYRLLFIKWRQMSRIIAIIFVTPPATHACRRHDNLSLYFESIN